MTSLGFPGACACVTKWEVTDVRLTIGGKLLRKTLCWCFKSPQVFVSTSQLPQRIKLQRFVQSSDTIYYIICHIIGTMKCNIIARWLPLQISAAWFKNTFSLKLHKVRFKGPAQCQAIGVVQSLLVQSQTEAWWLEEGSLAAVVAAELTNENPGGSRNNNKKLCFSCPFFSLALKPLLSFMVLGGLECPPVPPPPTAATPHLIRSH